MTIRSHKPEPLWTTRRLLDWTTRHLDSKQIDSPRLSAEILLAHVLGVPRLNLYMDMDRPASPLERSAYRELVERASAHEPVQYLVGSAHFFSLSFTVDRRVLIPRPSTETLVEHVISHTRRTPGFASPLIADIGTGSGAIAIAIAKNLPEARIVATDISADALQVAHANAIQHAVADRIEFHHGPALEPLTARRFRFIVSNPPYIRDSEWLAVPPNVRHEPHTALRAGSDGLDMLRPLIQNAHHLLDRPGQLVLEIASSQESAILQLATQIPHWHNPRVLPDHEKLPRMFLADL